MFLRYNKKHHAHRTHKILRSTNDLILSSPATMILAEEKRALLLEKNRKICAFNAEHYEHLWLNLNNRIANHCQLLPETSNNYWIEPGGLLDHALHRTDAALELFQQFLILDPKLDEYSENQKLWQYVLFSASMLQGMGKLQVDYKVQLYDANGVCLGKWNPLLTDIQQHGGIYYDYKFETEVDLEFRRHLNLLIGRLLMPEDGFALISSESEILSIWLALLHEDYNAAGTLGAILVRANAIALQRYLNQLKLQKSTFKVGDHYNRVGTFPNFNPDAIDVLEQKIGIEFIQWLAQSLEAGELILNQAHLLMAQGGVLLGVEVFKLFVKSHPEYRSWVAVQNGFLSLGLHKDANGILANYTILPDFFTLERSNGELLRLSAVDLIYTGTQKEIFRAPALTATGKWCGGVKTQNPTDLYNPSPFGAKKSV